METVKTRLLSILKWGLLLFILFITFLPLLWTVLASLKTNNEIWESAFRLPAQLRLDNYYRAISLDGFFLAFLNTIVVASLSTVSVCILASMAAYALLGRFKGSNLLFIMLIAGIYIPINTFMLPYFSIARWIGLYDTLAILIIIYTAIGMPLSLLILRNYMGTIPREIEESALMDGCSYPMRYSHIILPLATPGIMAASIFNFVAFWNEFFYALLLTVNKASRTLQISLRFFSGQFTNDYAALFAALFLSILPTILAYILFQEKIISGLTSGTFK